MSYWSQWTSAELLSIHGVEEAFCEIDEDDEDEEEFNDKEPSCPRCAGTGCNQCLMCDY